MAKPGKEKPEEPEMRPDAWDRFRQAVHVMAKAGPQHRIGGAAVKSGPKHKLSKQKKRGAATKSQGEGLSPTRSAMKSEN